MLTLVNLILDLKNLKAFLIDLRSILQKKTMLDNDTYACLPYSNQTIGSSRQKLTLVKKSPLSINHFFINFFKLGP
jgi:hypothetical protein